MHELSIAVGLVDTVLEEAARRGLERVDAVHLELGVLSGVVDEALRHSYELATYGTRLEGSRLVIEEVAAQIDCRTCGAVRPIASVQHFTCITCGTPGATLVRGRELQVVALDVL